MNWLKKLRIDHGIPVTELCDGTGLSREAFYRIERGTAQLKVEHLKRLTDYAVSMGYLPSGTKPSQLIEGTA